MPLASSGACRRYRRRGISTCRLHPGFLAVVAGGEAATHAACIRLRRSFDACRLGATGAEISSHDVCIYGFRQALPATRPRPMPLGSSGACRSCQRLGIGATRLQPWLLASVAGGEAAAHAACIQRCSQSFRHQGINACRLPWRTLPAAKLRRMPLVSSGACRSYRRRGISACRLHLGFLAGTAGGEAAAHAACIQWSLQEVPAPWYQRMPLASVICGRRCRPRASSGNSAFRFRAGFLAGAVGGEASTHAAWELPAPR